MGTRLLRPGAVAGPASGWPLVLFVQAALLLAGCQSSASRRSAPHAVGGLELAAWNRPTPPRVGNNTLVMRIRDAGRAPLRDARIEALVSMPAMGSMPAMQSRGLARETSAGVYEAKYRLQAGGEWDVFLRVRPDRGTPVDATFRLSTSTRELAFVSGTPASDAGPAGRAGPGGASTPGAAPQGSGSPGAASEEIGAVSIDAGRRQALGIRTEAIGMRNLTIPIRAAGRVAFDEERRADVSLKFGGWVRAIRADYVGRPVRAGEVLFLAYSPELWSAQQEYLEALRAARDVRAGGSRPA